MREIKFIVIHCSATPPKVDYTKEKMWRDHVRVRKWDSWGYHYYIRRDGTLEELRPVELPGAHVKGFNQKSIGVCYEGGLNNNGEPMDTRTAEQTVTMYELLVRLMTEYPDAEIVGHRDLLKYRTKACPCFDARKEYEGLAKKE